MVWHDSLTPPPPIPFLHTASRAWLLDKGFDPSGIKMEGIGDRTGGSNGRVGWNWSSIHWRRRQSSGVPPKGCSRMAQQLHEASHKGSSEGSPWDSGRETESSWVARRFVVCRPKTNMSYTQPYPQSSSTTAIVACSVTKSTIATVSNNSGEEYQVSFHQVCKQQELKAAHKWNILWLIPATSH